MRRFLAATAALLAALPGAARADASVATAHATVSLLAATTEARADTPIGLALRIALAPGWHTYWSNPGDAGLPPAVTVAIDGAAPVPAALGFPAPRRIDEGGLVGFGYTGAVTFPFRVTPPSGSGPVRLAAQASFLVCSTVCVPAEAAVSLAMPRTAGTPAASPDAGAVADAERSLPRAVPVRATVSANGRLAITGAGLGRDTVVRALFFPSTAGLIDADAAQSLRTDRTGIALALRPEAGWRTAHALDGVLAVTDRTGNETAIAIRAAIGGPAPPDEAPSRPLLALVLLAAAGGVLLNGMPCVFPVLAIKALALARAASSADRHARRRSALLYAAGTIGSLVGLGVVLLLLRAGGSGVAWGYQLQSPPVVGLTALVLFAVGLNLLGLFEIAPGRVAGVGQGVVGRGGAAGDLAAGALAVLVATPCTAPFMGAALAGALAGPPAAAVAVFASLGLGLALPMLLLGFLPGAAKLFPRPGAWMETLRRLLAWPMFAAALWLVWVVSVEAGPPGVLRIGGALLLVGFAAFVPGLFGVGRRPIGLASGLAAALLAMLLLPTIGTAPTGGAQSSSVAGAEPFSAARLDALTGAGRPVLVDMSAAWCLTCLVNERVALAPAASALRRDGVVLLRGDWTRRDGAITAFLRRFDREGVPLVVFFPAQGAPRVLPQILTERDVEDAIDGVRRG